MAGGEGELELPPPAIGSLRLGAEDKKAVGGERAEEEEEEAEAAAEAAEAEERGPRGSRDSVGGAKESCR